MVYTRPEIYRNYIIEQEVKAFNMIVGYIVTAPLNRKLAVTLEELNAFIVNSIEPEKGAEYLDKVINKKEVQIQSIEFEELHTRSDVYISIPLRMRYKFHQERYYRSPHNIKGLLL